MPESLSPELVSLRDRIDELARTELVPLAEKNLQGVELSDAVRDLSKSAGLFTMTQPEAFGGTAASALAMLVVRDTLASHNVSHLPGLFGPGPGVLAGVDEPLASSHLKPLLAGEKRGAFAFTEPDSAPRHTWGVINDEQVVINGQKSYVTGGSHADFMNALVEIEGHGPAMIVIDTNLPGVNNINEFGSLDGSHHTSFEFKDVTVPVSRIIGKPGEGIPRALRQIGDTRLAFAADCAGLARWVIEYVTEYLQAPHRSGQPLGAREGVRFRYSDMRIKAYAARSMVYRTARLADAGENIINEGIACKVFATEAIGEIVDQGIQLIGGKALTIGHPLEILYRRVRSMRLAEGASDVLRINMAKGRLELGKGRI